MDSHSLAEPYCSKFGTRSGPESSTESGLAYSSLEEYSGDEEEEEGISDQDPAEPSHYSLDGESSTESGTESGHDSKSGYTQDSEATGTTAKV